MEREYMFHRLEGAQEPPPNPLQVTGSSQDKQQRGYDTQFEPCCPSRDVRLALNLPPQLSLPIQEEVYTAGVSNCYISRC
jgi:hypothetical protein